MEIVHRHCTSANSEAVLFLTLMILFLLTSAGTVNGEDRFPVTEPPQEVVKQFDLDPFYKKYTHVNGFPIISSERTSDYALKEAAYLIQKMLRKRSDVIKALIKNNVRFVVMSHDERTTDIPEYSSLSPAEYWDRRARGLGATRKRPVVSCGEENLLEYPGDPYPNENILIHEFAHSIHELGVNEIDSSFQSRLESVYQNAKDQNLWQGMYADKNVQEYWAEGVQSWFGTNRTKGSLHNHVDTRKELKEYDPKLADLIDEVFRDGGWTYTPPSKRTKKKHLKGYDPDSAPTFEWSKE